jgi:hypothetical protein
VNRSLFLLVFLPGCFGTCNGDPTPMSETCEPGAPRGVVTEVDIGTYTGGVFEQLADGDIVPQIFGGQGSPMLVLNLRLRGSDLPDCMPQVTQLYSETGQPDGSEGSPLVTDQVLPDTWITGDMLLVTYDVYGGSRATIESTAGGVTTAVEVWIDYAAPVDAAAPDAAVVPDAAWPDAMP